MPDSFSIQILTALNDEGTPFVRLEIIGDVVILTPWDAIRLSQAITQRAVNCIDLIEKAEQEVNKGLRLVADNDEKDG